MQTLIAYLFALLVALPQPPNGADESAERERFMGIAKDIATVSSAKPIYGGPEGVTATALTLFAVGRTESAFWGKVQDCSLCYPGSQWCDRGRSITVYQLQGHWAWGKYNREQLCASNAAATERAHAILFKFRKSHSTLAMFAAYMRGGHIHFAPPKGAKDKESTLQHHLRKKGIVVTYKNGGLYADQVRSKTP